MMWPLTCEIKGIQNRRETIETLGRSFAAVCLTVRTLVLPSAVDGGRSQCLSMELFYRLSFSELPWDPIALSGATHELFTADGRQTLQVTRSVL